jgi:two-component system response regulator GlrR
MAVTRDWLLEVDRERRNAMYRSVSPVRSWSKPVKPVRLPVAGLLVEMPSFMEAQRQFVRCYLQHVLTVSGGNVSWAARLARRNRTDFHRLLVKYKLDAAAFRGNRRARRAVDATAVPLGRTLGGVTTGYGSGRQ